MPSTLGYANTSNAPTDLLVKSYASEFMRVFPGGGPAPIWAIMANLATGKALQFEHGYYTKTMVFPEFQINNGAGYNSAATSLTVDSSANIVVGQTFQNFRTKEQVLVTEITSGTVIVVQRGVGVTAAAAIVDDDYFPMVGNAQEEASDRPTSAIIMPTRTLNLTQIFRNSWTISDSLRATMTIAGDGNVAESRQDCALFHSADMEKAILFGERFSGTLNNQPFRKMDGIISSVSQYASGNITTAGATTTYDQLETALDPVFNYQSNPAMAAERWLFVGSTALKVINKIGRLSGQYQIVDGATSFGLQFQTFKISRGTFHMVEHPLLNTNTSWAKMAIALDFSAMKLAYLANRKTKSEEFGFDGKNVQDGKDAIGGSLTTEMTLELRNPFAQGVVYNLTAAA